MTGSVVKNLEEFVHGAPLVVDKDGDPSGEDIELAVFLLLGEISHADLELGVAEVREIVDSMAKEFGTSEERVVKLAELAHQISLDESKKGPLLTALTKRLTPDQRTKVLSLIWRVILADGVIKKSEVQMAEEITKKLGLSDNEAKQARILAEKQILPEGFTPAEE